MKELKIIQEKEGLITKAEDIFEFLILNLSAAQFIELYKIMTEYMESIKNA